jgi:hypothetical protein
MVASDLISLRVRIGCAEAGVETSIDRNAAIADWRGAPLIEHRGTQRQSGERRSYARAACFMSTMTQR